MDYRVYGKVLFLNVIRERKTCCVRKSNSRRHDCTTSGIKNQVLLGRFLKDEHLQTDCWRNNFRKRSFSSAPRSMVSSPPSISKKVST
ncbi:hypothetical protein PUN28_012316 [Cardiocondyla obscurior]|uniref:Uncharacterized protein n=1 Tax=Cardiocondyla obscurior TaxID=286306 RepID=A0AAW2FGC2_9HYME